MSAAMVAIAISVAAVIEVSGTAGTVIMLLPVAILLLVVIRSLRSQHRETAPISKSKTSSQSDIMSVIHSEGPATSPRTNEPSAEAAAPAPMSTATAAASQAVISHWPARIEAAEAANDLASVASHYLAYAREEIANGRAERAADHLRSSVRASAKGRHAAIQAEARLELAELARNAGDLTTACEHWQIARGLFHGLNQPAKLGETEKLMQKHGCPTDWVLNDF